MCLQLGLNLLPLSIPHQAAQTSVQGQVSAFQREKINLDPGVVQVKDYQSFLRL